MARLEKSIKKKNAILETTLELITEGGFQAASMAKVAKLAGVSPATIYLYFEGKDDLIDKLYIKTKNEFVLEAFKNYEKNMSVEDGFRVIWHNIADYKLKETKESYFLSQCDNTPIVSDETFQIVLKLFTPLTDLWQRGIDEGLLKSMPHSTFYAYTIYPINFLVNNKKRNFGKIGTTEIDQAFCAAWDSIRNH